MKLEKFFIKKDATVIGAMEQLDSSATRILFVIDNKKLVGSITDGDIRRWILKKGEISASVEKITNFSPKYLNQKGKHMAKEYMKENGIFAVPITNDNAEVVSVFLRDEEFSDIRYKLPVVIMAGGFGTRLYPYTKILPKPLIPIGEIPIVEHIINKFNKIGYDDFHLIVNHKKNMIKSYFNDIDKEYNVFFEDEDVPLGTGGGLSLLKGKIKDTFILTNCDILIEENYSEIVEHHKKEGNLVTMVCSLKNVEIPYGVIEISETGGIEGFKEKPKLSFFTNTGMYIVEPKIIEDLAENTKIGFPTIIENYKNAGEKIGVYPISEGLWLDMGTHEEMEKMKRRLGV